MQARPAATPLHRFALRHPAGETAIVVGEGALEEGAGELAPWLAGRTVFVVSTPRVLELHGARLAPLRRAAGRSVVLTVPDGEAAKTVGTAERLWDEMLAAGGKRDSRLLAFGGGSTGDLGGFAAGCFLRGIAYAQLPTTLLAQVDAALGGKTGVDLPGGKNAVGLFHHPDFVLSDTAVLATLPREELRSGLVEAIKMGALLDAGLFAAIEADLDRLLAGDPAALAPVVARAAAAKVAVVERDPGERDERRLLNYGHTLGHAIEAALAYAGLRHGEAVAYGILFALRLAERDGAAPPADGAAAERTRALLRRLDLPPLPPLAPEALLPLLERDKKAREGGLAWVLPAALGRGRIVEDVPLDAVRRELAPFLADPFAAA
ncbi:MAG TPA: 3-dehydroquinate synthase [Thermoanaerobaculia bacterium]|nr:3-dehydroquinate synthase [Thermoanaerobaculia bacterium]